MNETEKIIRDLIKERLEALNKAEAELNAVMKNPDHGISEMIHASSDFHRASGEYNGVMKCLIALMESGAV